MQTRALILRPVAALLAVILVGSLLLLPAAPADAAGVNTHGWMAVDAIDLVADPDLRALLDAHREQVRAGAIFPDVGYVPGNTFGEEAHWQRFVDAYVDQIRARDDCPDLRDPDGPCAPMIAHLMGVAGHGMGDEVWDWLFEPYSPDLDEYWTHPEVPFANEGGAEAQLDIVAVGHYGLPRPAIPPLPSTAALQAAFAHSGLPGVAASEFDLAGAGTLAWGQIVWDASSFWADRFLADVRAAMPWMSDNMVTAPGGVDWAATAIAGYWTSIWGRLLGDQPPTSVSITYPAPGQVDVPATGWERTFQPGSARGRGGARNRITAALSYSRPYRPGASGPAIPQEIPPLTMTITERATGELVPVMAGYPRSVPYNAEAGEHLIDVQPANDLEPCTWYDVAISHHEPLVDGTDRAVLPYWWAFRTDDGVGSPCPSSTSTLTGTVTGPDGQPVAGAFVLAYAPGDGLLPSDVASTRTDGTYVLPALEPGSYRLAFVPPAGSGLAIQWSGGASGRAQATDVAVPTGAAVDAQLTTQPQVSGTVSDPQGAPLPGVQVLAFSAGATWVPTASATTGPDGAYALTLAPGTYHLALVPPAGSGLPVQWLGGVASRAGTTPVDAVPGASTAADHQVLTASVAGVVSGPSGVLPGTRVLFYADHDRYAPSFELVADGAGAVELDAATPGSYRVLFVPPAASGLPAQWSGGAATRKLAPVVELVAGETTDVSTTLAGG